ncbi:unnamed protein product [Protopolystoma xenopodis]|uniref:Uncharacterized protein n=1 Tax=Protopolystoma xenopodis TaxID=117903 RepID=A0A3S5ALL9_9PLAT|nr:unnamed protein product [Protopolystoma xenopodis]
MQAAKDVKLLLLGTSFSVPLCHLSLRHAPAVDSRSRFVLGFPRTAQPRDPAVAAPFVDYTLAARRRAGRVASEAIVWVGLG